MPNHNDLQVYKRSMTFSIVLHQLASTLSTKVAHGLRSQLLRCAASIPANIAEGAGQNSDARFAHFLSIAIGSANEVEAHLALARGMDLISEARCNELEDEVQQIRRMLYGLRKRLEAAAKSLSV